MKGVPYHKLSRRERELMDVIFELSEASAAEIRDRLADAPSYSAVRATLRILEEKGCLTHRRDGRRYVFVPTASRANVRERALGRLVRTFFDNSPEQALAALLDLSAKELSERDLARIMRMVEEARRRDR